MKRRTFLAGLLGLFAAPVAARAAISAPMPRVFGTFQNVPLRTLDPALSVFEIHDAPLTSITAIYDGGVSLDVGADFPTRAALEAADLPLGSVGTCLNEGIVRASCVPVYNLSADVVAPWGDILFDDQPEITGVLADGGAVHIARSDGAPA